MTELVHGEILVAAESRESAVRDRAAPHDLAHRLVVFVMCEDDGRILRDILQERFGEEIGEFVAFRMRHVALKRVHDDVGDACRKLRRGQGKGQFGVQNGEGGAVERRRQSRFLARFLIRQHGGIARLAARRRKCQDDADRQALFELFLARPEIP